MGQDQQTSTSQFEELAVDGPTAARLIRRRGPRPANPIPGPTHAASSLHRGLDGYQPTPLTTHPDLAAELGLGGLYLKNESSRLGLQSFKILGASWAVYRALCDRLDRPPPPDASLAEIRRAFADLGPLTLVAATDGNHGRALAAVGRMFGFPARILVPDGMAAARIEAIEAEGASVEVVNGSYDLAVEKAAAVDEDAMVVSDTSWDGYEELPTWISEGYATIFWEIDEALESNGWQAPDLVVVQIGVGALARAVVAHYRRAELDSQPTILGVEPLTAACAFETALAGHRAYVPGPHPSVLVGLNAGRVSIVAEPALISGIDGFLAIDDSSARAAVARLAASGIMAGETGAAGLGGLLALPDAAERISGNAPAHALLLITEGMTDPVSYADSIAASSQAADG